MQNPSRPGQIGGLLFLFVCCGLGIGGALMLAYAIKHPYRTFTGWNGTCDGFEIMAEFGVRRNGHTELIALLAYPAGDHVNVNMETWSDAAPQSGIWLYPHGISVNGKPVAAPHGERFWIYVNDSPGGDVRPIPLVGGPEVNFSTADYQNLANLAVWKEKVHPELVRESMKWYRKHIKSDKPCHTTVIGSDKHGNRVEAEPPAEFSPVPAEKLDAAEPLITNSIGMKLVLIRPGEFVMGETWQALNPDARGHLVRITVPYYLGQCEVTVGQFRKFVDATHYQTEQEKRTKYQTWRNAFPDYPWTEEHPAFWISWNDAHAFCQWLSAKEGNAQYHLPTEAQWEYACRAGAQTRFCYGNDEARLGDYAWYGANSGSQHCLHLHPVGQKKPNAWGLYDMHGNTEEWCADWYADDYYDWCRVADPCGPSAGKFRVRRGGYAYESPGALDTSVRQCAEPNNPDFGFRVARTFGAKAKPAAPQR